MNKRPSRPSSPRNGGDGANKSSDRRDSFGSDSNKDARGGRSSRSSSTGSSNRSDRSSNKSSYGSSSDRKGTFGSDANKDSRGSGSSRSSFTGSSSRSDRSSNKSSYGSSDRSNTEGSSYRGKNDRGGRSSRPSDSNSSRSPFEKKSTGFDKSFGKKPRREGDFDNRRDGEKRSYGHKSGDASFKPRSDRFASRGYDDKKFDKKVSRDSYSTRDNKLGDSSSYSDRPKFNDRNASEPRPFRERSRRIDSNDGNSAPKREGAPSRRGAYGNESSFPSQRESGRYSNEDAPKKTSRASRDSQPAPKAARSSKSDSEQPKKIRKTPAQVQIEDGSENAPMRLNRFIALAGVCARREADELIAEGKIKVNGKVVTEMGYKVMPGDDVRLNNKSLERQRFVYVLLNKPKDFITTTDDPEGRRTIMELVEEACTERIYPVGRLDRNTTGLILLTNDGELAKKLSHPSHKVEKIYQVTLNKELAPEDFEKIKEGIVLEDGPVEIDAIEINPTDATMLGVEIHIGRNRIVRRIFEHLGYDVVRLDRVVYAGLTKRNLGRGKWRLLTDMEVVKIKHLK